jgi:hypothetical protein
VVQLTEERAAVAADRPLVATKNRRIVEGALLADVAVVLLLGRIYIPIPGLRMLWRLLAASPFVLLSHRQGFRIAIMSGLVGYVLLTAFVGPSLALPALDCALAGMLIAAGQKLGWPKLVITAVCGAIYAVCDIIIPTIAFSYIFRLPFTVLVRDVRSGIQGFFKDTGRVIELLNQLLRALRGRNTATLDAGAVEHFGVVLSAFFSTNWVWLLVAAGFVIGVVNMFGYQLAAEFVLTRLPSNVVERPSR